MIREEHAGDQAFEPLDELPPESESVPRPPVSPAFGTAGAAAAQAGCAEAALAEHPAVAARLTAIELARFLTYIECGYSLRQASESIGQSHTAMIRIRDRCVGLRDEMRRREKIARDRPLRHLHEASQHSWRAAAWLLNYLEAQPREKRERGG
jgi:hypothetical protein